MPIETLDDIVEELADKFGIYGIGQLYEEGNHPTDCKCRICFCAWLKGRIERAVEVENTLKHRSNGEH